MLDKYNREINYLRVSITDRCNLHCRYCRPKEGLSLIGHDDILRYEEIIRVVCTAVKIGLVKVRVTGGEPLVRRGFIDFIAELKKINGLLDISLTTNGVLLSEFAEKIQKAGITRINISLDSLNAAKYASLTNGGNLNDVLKGIAKVEELGFHPIKINTVAIKNFTDDELFAFVQLAERKPFQVRFIELMPMNDAENAYSEDFLPREEILKAISQRCELEPLNGPKSGSDGPAEIYRIKGGRGEIGFINPVSSHFCSTCNRLRLTADGKLRVCLLHDQEIDLKKPLRENLSDVRLEALIREAILLKPLKHELGCASPRLKKCLRNMSAIGG